MPITVGGSLKNTADKWAIKSPDGKFEIPGMCIIVRQS
jgi:hypothetical protein